MAIAIKDNGNGYFSINYRPNLIQDTNGWEFYDSLPPKENIEGKYADLRKDTEGNLYWEYFDLPKTQEEIILELEQRVQTMQQALDDLVLGGTL